MTTADRTPNSEKNKNNVVSANSSEPTFFENSTSFVIPNTTTTYDGMVSDKSINSQNIEMASLENMSLKRALLSSEEDNDYASVKEVRMHKKIKVLKSFFNKTKKNVKRLQMKNSRCEKKYHTLKNIIKELENKNLLSEEQILEMFGSTGPSKALINQQVQVMKRGKKFKQYSPEIRKFAMNLHFYSPKAYEYVRSSFGKCLPHQRVISTWYRYVLISMIYDDIFKENRLLFEIHK